MDNGHQQVTGSAPEDVGGDASGMTSRDAADTVIGAVTRAGPPWSFVPSGSLAGRDLQDGASRSWPVVLSDGEMLGVVVRARDASSQHDELITVLLRTVAALLSAEQEAASARLRADVAEQAARIDPMTGLSNRRAWDDALVAEAARMRRSGKAAVVVVIDIDALKETNDNEGHLAGDLLIRRTAEGLRSAVRDADIVARLGGDEFGVLAVESGPEVPDTLLKRIDECLHAVEVRASVGAAAAPAGTSLHDAFARADENMYAAKRERKASRGS